MLYEIMRHCRNFFVIATHGGKYEIKNGEINLPFLNDGQFFMVEGSAFNDGVYRYPAHGLTNEVFDGWVHAQAVPPAFLALVEEIETWCNTHADAINSPYTSESFGGYTYTKDANASSWVSCFAHRLRGWRKV